MEGLSPLVVSRNVSAITVHLSTGTQALDTSHPGYQPPLPADQVVSYKLCALQRSPANKHAFRASQGASSCLQLHYCVLHVPRRFPLVKRSCRRWRPATPPRPGEGAEGAAG